MEKKEGGTNEIGERGPTVSQTALLSKEGRRRPNSTNSRSALNGKSGLSKYNGASDVIKRGTNPGKGKIGGKEEVTMR